MKLSIGLVAAVAAKWNGVYTGPSGYAKWWAIASRTKLAHMWYATQW